MAEIRVVFLPNEIFREKETVTVTLRSSIEDLAGNFVEAGAVQSTTGLVVWPGDTNNDGQVDIFDILPLGQFWEDNGPTRPNGRDLWEFQAATAWPVEAATYADANGEERIDADDILTINKNWKQRQTTLPISLGPATTALGIPAHLGIYEQLYTTLVTHSKLTSRSSAPGQLLHQIINRLKQQNLPTMTKLLNNYPNLFNPETWIPYQLAQAAEVTIRIYDMRGQIVRILRPGYKPVGYYMTKAEAAYLGWTEERW